MKMIYKLSKSIKAIAVFLLVFFYELFYVWTINNTIEYTVDKHVKLIFEKGIKKEFILLVLLMLALTAIRQILIYITKLYNKNLATKLRFNVYSSMTDYAFKENIEKDRLYTLISDNLESVISVFSSYMDYLLVIAASVGSAAYIVTLDLRIAMVLVVIGLSLLAYSFIFKDKLYKKEEILLEKNENLKEYNNFFYETVLDRAKYADLKYEEEYDRRFKKYKIAFKDANIASLKYLFTPYILGFAQTYLPIIIIYFWKIDITLGELMALLLTITSFMGIFRNTVDYIAELEKKKAAYKSIETFLGIKDEEISEEYIEKTGSALEVKDLKLKLANHELCFDDMNISKNGLYIIKGEKGIGKTTFFKAILGDKNIDYSGTIKLYGKDIRECSRNYISRCIAYMQQDSPIIDGDLKTVFTNIRASITDEEMINILKSVAIVPDEFQASNYHELLNKFIEQNQISEGQRQRLSLAYTLAMDKDIVLLDEPTSHLDRASKEIIIDTLKKVSKEKLVLTISHDEDLISTGDNVFKFNISI